MALVIITTDDGTEVGRTRVVLDGEPWGAQLIGDMNYITGCIQIALEQDDRQRRLNQP